MRTRLRPAWQPAELAALYSRRYDHTRWPDHVVRVAWTAGMLAGMDPGSVADLSCGDGSVTRLAGLSCPVILGDLTPGWDLSGPAEETITQLAPVDVLVCSETVEHMDDPDAFLALARDHARRLLLTTPDGETGTDNPEHYWGWDAGGVRAMLTGAGWTGRAVRLTPWPGAYYTFQAWRCQ